MALHGDVCHRQLSVFMWYIPDGSLRAGVDEVRGYFLD